MPDPIFPFVEMIQLSPQNEVIVSPNIIKKYDKEMIIEMIARSSRKLRFERVNNFEIACLIDDELDSVWLVRKRNPSGVIQILLCSSEL